MRCLLPLALVGCTAVVDLEHLDGAGGGKTTSSASNAGAGGSAGPGGQSVGGAASGYAPVVIADGALGYWRLDEDSGATATSLVEGGPLGTYSDGCTFGVPGAVDGGNNAAVEFDGVSCRIDFGNVFAFEGMSEFSLEAWVKPGVDDSPLSRIFSKEALDESGSHQGYDLLLDGVTISFDRWLDDQLESVDAAVPLSPGSFTHVVATYDGSRMSVYINGRFASGSDTAKALVNAGGSFMVGASAMSHAFFAGVIDEIAVYGTALSNERVLAHYGAGLTGL